MHLEAAQTALSPPHAYETKKGGLTLGFAKINSQEMNSRENKTIVAVRNCHKRVIVTLRKFNGCVLLRNSSWAFISSLIASGVTFLLTMQLARHLSIESFGAVNVLMESLSTVIMLADMGTTIALINLYVKYTKNEDVKRLNFLIKSVAILKLVIGVTTSVIIIGYITITEKVVVELWFLSILFACACMEALYQNGLALFQCKGQYGRLAIYRVALPVIRFAVIVFLIRKEIIALHGTLFLYSLSVLVPLTFMLCKDQLFIDKIGIDWNSDVVKDFKEVALWSSLSSLMVILVMKMDIFFLLSLTNEIQIGIFSAAQKYAAIGTIISSATSMVLIPLAASVENKSELSKYLKSSIRMTAFFAAPVILLAYYASPMIVFIFGQKYEGASAVAQLLTLSFALGIFVNPISYLFYSLGCAKYLTLMNFMQFVLAFIVSFALIPSLGAYGSVMSNLFTRIFGAGFILLVFFFKVRSRVK